MSDTVKKTRTRFLWSLLFSLCVVLTGAIWTWSVGRQSNRIYHVLAHTTDAVEDLRGLLKGAHRS